MHWKLNPAAQQKLILLSDFMTRVHRLHGLVEQYATTRTNPQVLEAPIRRACEQLKQSFLGAGYGPLAQLAGSMALAAKRGGAVHGKARILREGVGSMRSQLETEQKATATEGRLAPRPEAEQE